MSRGAAVRLWEAHTAAEWRARWRLPQLVLLDETRSTNDVARALAADRVPAGTLVMAEHQTAGRGRMGREWTAAPGHALLLSFILRPTAGKADVALGTAPIRVGLAVAGALHEATGLLARLKWPNDVIVPGAGKLAGILCEAVTTGVEATIIAGIGINVHQRPADFPAHLRGSATSVAALGGADGAPAIRARIMDALTSAMAPLFTAPLTPLTRAEITQYASLDALNGRAVTASGSISLHGVARGVAPDGALLLDTPRGIRRVASASVRPDDEHVTLTRPRR